MRILFISTILGYTWGGADALWTGAARLLAEQGHSVACTANQLAEHHPEIKQLRADGVQVFIRKGHSTVAGGIRGLKPAQIRLRQEFKHLRRFIDQQQPDFVAINQGGVFDFLVEPLLIDWLKNRRIPFGLVCQANSEASILREEERVRAKQVFDAAAFTAFVSSHNEALAMRQVASAIPRTVLFQNPSILAEELLEFSWPPSTKWRLAFVGRLECAHKGLDVLFEALATAFEGISEWELDLFGKGPDEQYLRDLGRFFGIESHIRFCGYAQNVEMVWKDHHMLLLPSRAEGCSLAMLEAMAFGRPVLCTRVGGVDDWIEDGTSGFVAAWCEPRSVAEALERAWGMRENWRDMGQEAKNAWKHRHLPNPFQHVADKVVSEAKFFQQQN